MPQAVPKEGEGQEVHLEEQTGEVPPQESVPDADASAGGGPSSKEQEVGGVQSQEVKSEQQVASSADQDVGVSEGKQDNESLELADSEVLKEAGAGVKAPPPSSTSPSDTKDEL